VVVVALLKSFAKFDELRGRSSGAFAGLVASFKIRLGLIA